MLFFYARMRLPWKYHICCTHVRMCVRTFALRTKWSAGKKYIRAMLFRSEKHILSFLSLSFSQIIQKSQPRFHAVTSQKREGKIISLPFVRFQKKIFITLDKTKDISARDIIIIIVGLRGFYFSMFIWPQFVSLVCMMMTAESVPSVRSVRKQSNIIVTSWAGSCMD